MIKLKAILDSLKSNYKPLLIGVILMLGFFLTIDNLEEAKAHKAQAIEDRFIEIETLLETNTLMLDSINKQ